MSANGASRPWGVDVYKRQVIGLQQARARYETAVATRSLAQQTLEAEQNRFRFGESTIATVVQAQRDLAGDQSAEVQAMANYTHAKIAFDEAVGQTLSLIHISISPSPGTTKSCCSRSTG